MGKHPEDEVRSRKAPGLEGSPPREACCLGCGGGGATCPKGLRRGTRRFGARRGAGSARGGGWGRGETAGSRVSAGSGDLLGNGGGGCGER